MQYVKPTDSVRIDVDQLLHDRAAENREVYRKSRKQRLIQNEKPSADKDSDSKPKTSRKRKAEGGSHTRVKKHKVKSHPAFEQLVASSSKALPPGQITKVTLKLPPRPPKPKEPETFPCCLCVSMSKEGLLRVQDPPAWWYESGNAEAAAGPCMAHVECANVVPETWVDEVDVNEPDVSGVKVKESVVFGVDAIVKDRWNLVSVLFWLTIRYSCLRGLAEMHSVYEDQE